MLGRVEEERLSAAQEGALETLREMEEDSVIGAETTLVAAKS
ncbi:MAG TPA: hypothetical protein VH678_32115 [Xanthobacteraceae bacterium]